MVRGLRAGACAVVAFGILATAVTEGRTAGAIALGACAAYGYAYDYGDVSRASAAALVKCAGKNCQVVATMQRACAAIAVDARHACGPHGFAVAPRLGRAQNTALRECYKYGGRDCVIRA